MNIVPTRDDLSFEVAVPDTGGGSDDIQVVSRTVFSPGGICDLPTYD